MSTIGTYFSKYLINYLVYEKENGHFVSQGIQKLASNDFFSHMSQKSIKLSDAALDPRGKNLRQRSLDAFCLAIENYNRLTLNNRVEVFCILMANAWELLLKS